MCRAPAGEAQAGSFAFLPDSPLLLRHVVLGRARPSDLPPNATVVLCEQQQSMLPRVAEGLSGHFNGVVGEYGPDGERTELGSLVVNDDDSEFDYTVVFDTADAHTALDELRSADWLVADRTRALIAQVVLQYTRGDTKISSVVQLLWEAGPAGVVSFSVRAHTGAHLKGEEQLSSVIIALAVLLLVCSIAQGVTEFIEYRKVGWRSYVRDPWNPVEILIILCGALLFALMTFTGVEMSTVTEQKDSFADTFDACRAFEEATLDGCPQLDGLAPELRLSPCRTQLLFGLGRILQDVCIVLGTMVLLTGVHWIKYLELFPRLALPVFTITSTFLDLTALLLVVTLLSIFFAIAFMLFLGQVSSNFSNFNDSLLSMWLLTLGNIEYMDLLWRDGPGKIYEREGSPAAMVEYIIYHWMVVVILMSLFIAVLTTGYDKAKKKVRDKIQKHRESFRGLLDSGKLHRKASSTLVIDPPPDAETDLLAERQKQRLVRLRETFAELDADAGALLLGPRATPSGRESLDPAAPLVTALRCDPSPKDAAQKGRSVLQVAHPSPDPPSTSPPATPDPGDDIETPRQIIVASSRAGSIACSERGAAIADASTAPPPPPAVAVGASDLASGDAEGEVGRASEGGGSTMFGSAPGTPSHLQQSALLTYRTGRGVLEAVLALSDGQELLASRVHLVLNAAAARDLAMAERIDELSDHVASLESSIRDLAQAVSNQTPRQSGGNFLDDEVSVTRAETSGRI